MEAGTIVLNAWMQIIEGCSHFQVHGIKMQGEKKKSQCDEVNLICKIHMPENLNLPQESPRSKCHPTWREAWHMRRLFHCATHPTIHL